MSPMGRKVKTTNNNKYIQILYNKNVNLFSIIIMLMELNYYGINKPACMRHRTKGHKKPNKFGKMGLSPK